jgi:hypothetical protein
MFSSWSNAPPLCRRANMSCATHTVVVERQRMQKYAPAFAGEHVRHLGHAGLRRRAQFAAKT